MSSTTENRPPQQAAAVHPHPHSVADTLALLQPWIEFVPRQQRRLGIFICLALAIHIAAFFFISIEATRAELRPTVRTQLSMEETHPAAGREEEDDFWDQLADPRLFVLPVTPPGRFSSGGGAEAPDLSALAIPTGSPDWPAAAPAPGYDLLPAHTQPVSQAVAADMTPARQPFSYDESAPPPVTKTGWEWSRDLQARAPASMPDLPSPVVDTDLNPTELRVAVSPDGSVEHVLLEGSCLRPELDQQAILAAAKIRFDPVSSPGPAWGRATIFWHAIAPPREAVEPTPPPATGP